MKYKITRYVRHEEVAFVEATDLDDAYIQAIYADFEQRDGCTILDEEYEEIVE